VKMLICPELDLVMAADGELPARRRAEVVEASGGVLVLPGADGGVAGHNYGFCACEDIVNCKSSAACSGSARVAAGTG